MIALGHVSGFDTYTLPFTKEGGLAVEGFEILARHLADVEPPPKVTTDLLDLLDSILKIRRINHHQLSRKYQWVWKRNEGHRKFIEVLEFVKKRLKVAHERHMEVERYKDDRKGVPKKLLSSLFAGGAGG